MSAIQGLQGLSTAAPLAAQTRSQAAAPAPAPQAPATDTVQISSAARTALQQTQSSPAQESSETPAQTAREAAGGDSQAKAKLAREQAAEVTR